ISSRLWSATRGRNSRKYSRVSTGVLYIFQLAAITFFLMSQPFQFGIRLVVAPASCRLSRGRLGAETATLLLLRQRLDSRQFLSFQELKRSASAGRDERDLVSHVRGLHG